MVGQCFTLSSKNQIFLPPLFLIFILTAILPPNQEAQIALTSPFILPCSLKIEDESATNDLRLVRLQEDIETTYYIVRKHFVL
jgi:hypothetical protein